MGNEKSRPERGGGGPKLPALLGKKGPSVSELVERATKTGVLMVSGLGLKEVLLAISKSQQNRLWQVPSAMASLASNLRTFDLSSNKLTAIPPFFGDFTSLKLLHLDQNRLTQLPDELGHLKKLETLTVKGNQLTSFPDSLISCTSLKIVELADNEIREFPPPLAHLPALELVDLSGNRLSSLPDIVSDCRVVELNLNRNQINALNAPALNKCPRLKVLRVEENCLAIGEFTEELLTGSKISLLAVNGNLFQERDLHQQPGWEAFQERYTQSRKKLY